MKLPIITILLAIGTSFSTWANPGKIEGKVTSEGKPLELVAVQIIGDSHSQGTITNENGYYELENIPEGEYNLKVRLIGFMEANEVIKFSGTSLVRNIELREDLLNLEQVVITGTRTSKKITDSPVIVDLIDSKTLSNIQACNLSEGLKFQPGLRVETDCQTCNYTQLRMNGLQGGYSQILINGRPVFSPLTGLYGMEQLPVNMIERIEVVRGGGSALYGSSAIGGTVNVITKIPKESGYDISQTYQNIDGVTDYLLNGNATALSHSGNAGASFFVSTRRRDWYDQNGDLFSELPKLKNNSFGTNLFFKPTENQKIDVSFSSIHEYRYGGEMVEKPAHMAQQSEERTHDILLGNIDYQINFNNNNSSVITYISGQQTDRTHYTGIMPDEETDIANHLANPPYGTSLTQTLQGGVQLNHRLANFIGYNNVVTLGGEYVMDDVVDEIEAYNYNIDQLTQNLGAFVQSDWQIIRPLTLLAGLRMDKHNLVDHMILSPRLSALYNFRTNTQFRVTWSTGFRAPQAFDADLHIAFAGGGISRVSLADNLKEERSQSWSASVNYDKASEYFIFGFTIEGFYTHLADAFYLHPTGTDEFGETFEKRNGEGATVKGGTLEFRANYDGKWQLESGMTFQSSLYDKAVVYIEGLEPRREFLRSPDHYGYLTLSHTPNKRLNTSINMVQTGSMLLSHYAGAPEQKEDAYKISESFYEFSFKTGYTFNLERIDAGLEIFAGIKNLTNAYQKDFDSGKNRDSNYVYGPSMPRTYFAGLRIKSF